MLLRLQTKNATITNHHDAMALTPGQSSLTAYLVASTVPTMAFSVHTIFFLMTAIEAFAPVSVIPRSSLRATCPLQLALESSSFENEMSELFSRIQNVKAADKLQESLSVGNLQLPTIVFDALLPNQKIAASTTDETFGRFLRNVGIGGMFVMTSINHSKRMLRRNGVVARIEIVDAKSIHENFAPTAVDFSIVGVCHCRLVGPSQNMSARVGRWRRVYDPDGEESALGWGMERFVDAAIEATSVSTTEETQETDSQQQTEWSTNEVDCDITDPDNKNHNATLVERVETILPLLDQWQSLASNTATYNDINVVATARLQKGSPGLRIDPAALIRNVLGHLGERPTDPMAFSFWGAALINPSPVALGVAPEIRGQILEATTTSRRLDILEWGIKRSIQNLQGTVPLN